MRARACALPALRGRSVTRQTKKKNISFNSFFSLLQLVQLSLMIAFYYFSHARITRLERLVFTLFRVHVDCAPTSAPVLGVLVDP